MAFFARLFGWFRRKPQQEVYDERHAYERCHGTRLNEIVVLPKPAPKQRVLPKLAGDYLQRCFEERLENRHSPPLTAGATESSARSSRTARPPPSVRGQPSPRRAGGRSRPPASRGRS